MSKTIEAYQGTTHIVTSNSVASVRVRHKLIGGALAGTVNTKGNNGGFGTNSIGITQATGWCDWQELGNHAGEVTVTIESTAAAGTDLLFLSEVEYYKKVS